MLCELKTWDIPLARWSTVRVTTTIKMRAAKANALNFATAIAERSSIVMERSGIFER